MTNSKALQEQINDLQSRVAHQEDTLQQLNDIIVLQATKIENLSQQVQFCQTKFQDINQWLSSLGIEKPPHY